MKLSIGQEYYRKRSGYSQIIFLVLIYPSHFLSCNVLDSLTNDRTLYVNDADRTKIYSKFFG